MLKIINLNPWKQINNMAILKIENKYQDNNDEQISQKMHIIIATIDGFVH